MNYAINVHLPYELTIRDFRVPSDGQKFAVYLGDHPVGVVRESIPVVWTNGPEWGVFSSHQALLVRYVERLLRDHFAAMRAAQKATSR